MMGNPRDIDRDTRGVGITELQRPMNDLDPPNDLPKVCWGVGFFILGIAGVVWGATRASAGHPAQIILGLALIVVALGAISLVWQHGGWSETIAEKP